MTTYRAIITDLDYAMKMDSYMGYRAVSICTAIIMVELVYSIFLHLTF